MIRKIIYLAFIAITMSCSSSHYLTVASMRGVICDGESGCLTPCYLVKSGDTNWRLEFIDNFPYEEGYEYKIEVDGNSEDRYVYDRTVSKTKKTSEGVNEWDIWNKEWGSNTPCEIRYIKK